MIRQIVPLFFTTDIPRTLGWYKDKLGFECQGTWMEPPVYAIVTRDGHAIHFRCAEPPTANPDKYADELLDAYVNVEDADALYAEYAAKGVEFTRYGFMEQDERGIWNAPGGTKVAWFRDPDGNTLSLSQHPA